MRWTAANASLLIMSSEYNCMTKTAYAPMVHGQKKSKFCIGILWLLP